MGVGLRLGEGVGGGVRGLLARQLRALTQGGRFGWELCWFEGGVADAAHERRTPHSHSKKESFEPWLESASFDSFVPVAIKQRKGDDLIVADDEGIRVGTTAESLGSLRGAFGGAGNVTAGNASQISDGGAATVVTTKAKAEARASERVQ